MMLILISIWWVAVERLTWITHSSELWASRLVPANAAVCAPGEGGPGQGAGPPHEPVRRPAHGGLPGGDVQGRGPVGSGRDPALPGALQLCGAHQSRGGEWWSSHHSVCFLFIYLESIYPVKRPGASLNKCCLLSRSRADSSAPQSRLNAVQRRSKRSAPLLTDTL